MSAYPADPQAVSRLSKSVEVLEGMEIIWPSAGRARDLLQGAKVDFEPSQKSETPPIERYKRTAEQPLDDTVMEGATSRSGAENFHLRTSNYHSDQGPTAVFSQTGHVDVPYGVTPTTQTSPPFYPAYPRSWQGEHPSQNPYPVSTSALPQMYSTGLPVDRRSSSAHGAEHRYPQYWNDYSTFTPLAPTARNTYPPAIDAESSQHNHNPLNMFMPNQYHQTYRE